MSEDRPPAAKTPTEHWIACVEPFELILPMLEAALTHAPTPLVDGSEHLNAQGRRFAELLHESVSSALYAVHEAWSGAGDGGGPGSAIERRAARVWSPLQACYFVSQGLLGDLLVEISAHDVLVWLRDELKAIHEQLGEDPSDPRAQEPRGRAGAAQERVAPPIAATGAAARDVEDVVSEAAFRFERRFRVIWTLAGKVLDEREQTKALIRRGELSRSYRPDPDGPPTDEETVLREIDGLYEAWEGLRKMIDPE